MNIDQGIMSLEVVFGQPLLFFGLYLPILFIAMKVIKRYVPTIVIDESR